MRTTTWNDSTAARKKNSAAWLITGCIVPIYIPNFFPYANVCLDIARRFLTTLRAEAEMPSQLVDRSMRTLVMNLDSKHC